METTFDLPDPEDHEALLAELKGLLRGDKRSAPLQDAEQNEMLREMLDSESQSSTPNVRASVLLEAESLVNGDRNKSYGDPNADFSRTAALWQIYLMGVVERNGGKLTLAAHDVAVMMALLKISRLAWSPEKRDSWVDLAGYSACGADCADIEYRGLL